MGQKLTTKELAKHFKVHIGTVRKWISDKIIQCEPKVSGEYRKFDLDKVLVSLGKRIKDRQGIIFINQALHVGKEEGMSKDEFLAKQYCVNNGWGYKVIIDNFLKDGKRGIDSLIEDILDVDIEALIICKEGDIDFSSLNLLKILCDRKNIQIVFLDKDIKNQNYIENELLILRYLIHAGCKDAKKTSLIEKSINRIKSELC